MTASLRLHEATRRCPKRMVHGPCGGVTMDGGCEVPGIRCSFVDDAAVLRHLEFSTAEVDAPAAAGESGDALPVLPRGEASTAFAALVDAGAVITADLPVRSVDPAVITEAGVRLRELTAVIAGEPPGLREALSPTHKALLLAAGGSRVVAGLTCRDRNRVALEGELAALADLGVSGVLAVTGDHPASTALPQAQPVFDLDATRLAALARRAGLFVAVAEQPSAPPVGYRPLRLARKAQAGAELGILNLCGDLAEIRRFTAALGATATPVPVLVSVPVLTSAATTRRLAALPGVGLPEELVMAVAGADDPVESGIAAAVAWAHRALAIPGVVGVHLSAIAAGGTEPPGGADAAELAAVDALASAAARLRAVTAADAIVTETAGDA